MKSRILMATLIVTLLMGARLYACEACDPASCDPCASCSKSCDLFAGLKKLVACNPCSPSDCGPCDGVVACSPCDADCGPCDPGCDPCGERKFVFGKRLRGFFSISSCGPCDPNCGPCDDNNCGPCDPNCDPCAADCGPCDDSCDTGCGRKFSLQGFFGKFRLGGRCGSGCNDPCGACNTDCDPCAADCGPCDNDCGPCDDTNCDPCGNSCGRKFGSIFDGPRRGIKRFFDGFRVKRCDPCDPCGTGPCDVVCNPCTGCNDCYSAPAASSLPEAAN